MTVSKYSDRKIMPPHILPEVEAFWKATSKGRLLLKRCDDCREFHYYPRDICPYCLSENTIWHEASGNGFIYSFSTMMSNDIIYTLAYVTLDEGVSVLTNIVHAEPENINIGQRVKVVFMSSEGGEAVPMFTPI